MSGKRVKAQRHRAARVATVAAAAAAQQLRGRDLWHGGAIGLEVGARLLTAREAHAVTMQTGRTFAHSHSTSYRDGTTNPQRVYFTTDRELARAFAAQMPERTGTLYRVEPVGPVEPDPDYAGFDVSWCAPGARIIAIDEENVKLDKYECTARVGPYLAWDPTYEPVYDAEGHFLPSPMMRAQGVTASFLADRFRPWTPKSDVIADLRRHLPGFR